MSGSYSRLYHRFAQEFPDVWADDRMFGAWTKLLVMADASWPMRPSLPRSVRRPVVTTLTGCGLLILDGDTYTVRGLDAERTRRRDAARTGAAKRWQSDGNANASPDAMPRRERDETSKAEKETPPPPAERGRRSDQTNPRATGTAPRTNGANPRANGVSPRQVVKREKRAPVGPNIAAILRAAAEGKVAE